LYLKVLEEVQEELDATREASTEKHDYREITYRKEDVTEVEKVAIGEILQKNPNLLQYQEAFIQKALVYFPELTTTIPLRSKKVKKSNMYFLEIVGRHLWEKWNADKTPDNQNNFVIYLFTIIDGVIFKYGRHKHGLSYGEVFQGAVIKLVQAMDKFDPKRIVGTDDRGNPIYARVYTYFTMILNYGITTITMAHGGDKIRNMSYDSIMRSHGVEDSATDASVIYQDFLIFLYSYKDCWDLIPLHQKILNKLYDMLSESNNLAGISNNLVYTLQTECGVKSKEVQEALTMLREDFGPLNIFTTKRCLNSNLTDAELN